MPVFDFDEDAFDRDFERVHLEEPDPIETVVDELQDISGAVNSSDGDDTDTYTPQAFEGHLLAPEMTMAIDINTKRRRRSSLYSRMSVKSGQPSSFSELLIPEGYDNSKHVTGKTLRDFKPLKVLGQGAYGKVYLVEDITTGKLFAQKQLRKPAIHIQEDVHAKQVARTLSERDILTNITHHANVVKLFYAFHDQDKFYLILEYIPGGELFHHLTLANNTLGNVFPEDDVAFYVAQMALAVKHLHGLGIVYRDLKPENCLLNSEGNLVLTDFGLSKSISEGDGSICTSIIGTPEYMAPEVLKGEDYGFGVDWWSLGVVIYDMMLGKPPFTGNSHKAILDKIMKNKLKIPYYFSMDLKDLLNKLLNKNPDKRYQVDDKWDDFKKHRFFRKIQWQKLEKQELRPPIVPIITDLRAAENFLEEFTGMKISLTEEGPLGEISDFRGFSYCASDSYVSKYINV